MSIIQQREKTHGYFGSVASVSQGLKDALRIGPYAELPDVHREALEMICVKMARIVCGDHYEPDHVIDIRGYAELVLKHIKQAVPSGSSLNEEPPDDSKEPDACDSFDYYVPRSGQPR